MKKRGYYTITIGKSEESDGVELTGHFSNNFWALFEEYENLNSLEECFAALANGIGISKTRQLIYCSVKAHCLLKELPMPFKNIYELGELMDDFSEDQFVEVMSALSESKVLGNELNLGIERNPTVSEDEDRGKSESLLVGKTT